jgi:hypothetical protein
MNRREMLKLSAGALVALPIAARTTIATNSLTHVQASSQRSTEPVVSRILGSSYFFFKLDDGALDKRAIWIEAARNGRGAWEVKAKDILDDQEATPIIATSTSDFIEQLLASSGGDSHARGMAEVERTRGTR